MIKARNCAWNLEFPVFISPILWNMCENLPYESVYFKELHNEQECYQPTIYRAGAAVVSTITSLQETYGDPSLERMCVGQNGVVKSCLRTVSNTVKAQ